MPRRKLLEHLCFGWMTWPVGLYQKHILLGGCATSATYCIYKKKSSDLERLSQKHWNTTYPYKLTEERHMGSWIQAPPVLPNFFSVLLHSLKDGTHVVCSVWVAQMTNGHKRHTNPVSVHFIKKDNSSRSENRGKRSLNFTENKMRLAYFSWQLLAQLVKLRALLLTAE